MCIGVGWWSKNMSLFKEYTKYIENIFKTKYAISITSTYEKYLL